MPENERGGLAEPVGEKPVTELAKQMGPDVAGHATHTGANRTAEDVRLPPASPGAAMRPEVASTVQAMQAAGLTPEVYLADEELEVDGQVRYRPGDQVPADEIKAHGWAKKTHRIDKPPAK